ncbi:MAG: RluA family pseudouridine synthase [Phycisphaerae bacterium]
MTGSRRCSRAPDILHVDAELLVVDKPAGVLSAPGRGGKVGLPDLIREHPGRPCDEAFRIVQRLHEQASGVIVYARTFAVQRNLTRQFAEGRAETTYLALVTGYVDADGDIDIPLYYDKRAGKLRASSRRGDPALTHYRLVERVAGNTLLECRPLKERTDQVRAHLAAIGHPLSVDSEFGGGRAVLLSSYKPDYRVSTRRAERPLVDRLTLHAATVSLLHPATGEPVQFAAPLPKDLRATLAQLGRLR